MKMQTLKLTIVISDEEAAVVSKAASKLLQVFHTLDVLSDELQEANENLAFALGRKSSPIVSVTEEEYTELVLEQLRA